MPNTISRERAKKLLNMVAEDRNIKKLTGKNKNLEDLFSQCRNFLYPPKANEKNIRPDEATEKMLGLLDGFKSCVKTVKTGSESQSGILAGDTFNIKRDVEKIFIADPSPETILLNYLNLHGEKNMATSEFQFISSLVGVMRGIHELFEHEKLSDELTGKKAEDRKAEISKKNEAASRAQVLLEQKAVESSISINDWNIKQLKDLYDSKEKKYEDDEKKYLKQLKEAQRDANAALDPGSAYKLAYQELKTSKQNLKKSMERQAKLEPLGPTIEAYENKELQQVTNTYNELRKAADQSKLEYESKNSAYEAASQERKAKIRKNIDTIDDLQWDEYFSDMLKRHRECGAQALELEKASLLLAKILGNPNRADKLETLAVYGNSEKLERALNSKRQILGKDEILQSGSDVEKYLIAKQMILDAFPEENGNDEVGSLFGRMEWNSFKEEEFQQKYNVLKKMISNRQTELQDALKKIEGDEDFKTYKACQKENGELQKLDDEEFQKLNPFKKKAESDSREFAAAAAPHENKCEDILNTLGVTNKSERTKLSDPNNCEMLHERFNQELNKEKENNKQLSEKVEKAEGILSKFDEDLLKSRAAQNNYSTKETKLGKKLVEIRNDRDKNRILKEKLNEVSDIKKQFMEATTDIFKEEEEFHKKIDENHRDNFAAKRISAQLEKLHKALTDPKRKSNSPEYEALKQQLEDTKKLFSGEAENGEDLTPQQRKQQEMDSLEALGRAANTYLTEKEKTPHIWPFASVTGYQRRAAANDILAFSKSASDMVENAPMEERKLEQQIQMYKTSDNKWKEKVPEQRAKVRMQQCDLNVKTIIEQNRLTNQGPVRSGKKTGIQNGQTQSKNDIRALGKF